MQADDASALEDGSSGGAIVPVFLQFLAGIWVAVAWHRYILLEEDGGAIIPKFNGSRIVSYLVQSLKIFLLSLGGAAVVAVLLASFLGESLAGLLVILIILAGVWVFYRISPVLPATALGTKASIGGAWNVTRDLSGAIFVMILILSVLFFVQVIVIEPIQFISVQTYLVLSSIQIWVYAMMGASVLTTIYGVAVENRAL